MIVIDVEGKRGYPLPRLPLSGRCRLDAADGAGILLKEEQLGIFVLTDSMSGSNLSPMNLLFIPGAIGSSICVEAL